MENCKAGRTITNQSNAAQAETTGITSEMLLSISEGCKDYAESFVMSLDGEGLDLSEIPFSSYMDELLETDVMSWIMGMWFDARLHYQCQNLTDEEYSVLQETANLWTRNAVYEICGFEA